MSDDIEVIEEERHAPEDRPMLARMFEAVEVGADGRNVEMLCAPFDRPAEVSDPPDHIPYMESFARGAFAGATKAANRVLLEFEHWHPGLSGVIGRGASLEERDDALYGRFRVLKGEDGDKALELIHDGVLTSASVFFQPLRSARVSGGFRRLRVHLDRVALCRVGAYDEAKVLAVRSALAKDEEDAEPRGIPMDDGLAARLASSGIVVPGRSA